MEPISVDGETPVEPGCNLLIFILLIEISEGIDHPELETQKGAEGFTKVLDSLAKKISPSAIGQ